MIAPELFSEVPAQPAAVQLLTAAAAAPVHAYLFVGPPGTGKRRAARAFAAALLCPEGGCGRCSHCARVAGGSHPDLILADHQGVTYSIRDDIRPLTVMAQRRPLEAARTVIVIPDAHLMTLSAPALLKTLEEPPPTTVFVLLADDMPREMATVRSRCVEVPFVHLSNRDVARWLIEQGIDASRAAELAEGAAGDAERARLLADDPGFVERLAAWRRIPDELDGSGSTAMRVAAERIDSLTEAAAPLAAIQLAEIEAIDAQAKAMGERSAAGRKDVVDRHKRELRRYQTAELRAGLGVLARRYRDQLLADAAGTGHSPESARRAAGAVDAISATARSLTRNPRQPLALEQLFVTLS